MAYQKKQSKLAKKLKKSKRKPVRRPSSPSTGNTNTTELLAIAKNYQMSGLPSQAETILLQIVAIDPANIEANYNLSILSHQQGNTLQAIKYLRKVERSSPNNAEVHSNLGFMFQSLGQLPEALTSFKRAAELMPGNPAFLNNFGNILQETGSPFDALKHFNKAIQLDPHYLTAYLNMGNTLLITHGTEEAIACYQKALNIASEHPEVHYKLAMIYQTKGETDKSRYHLGMARRFGYSISECNLLEAKLFYRGDNLQQALEILSKVEIQPHDSPEIVSDIFHLSGKINDRLGNEEKAYDYFVRSNKVWMDNVGSLNINPKQYMDKLKMLPRSYSRECLSKWSNVPIKHRKFPPLFMIGFPRSGTTLLDQILGTHSKLEVIEEKGVLFNLENKFYELHGENPEQLARLEENEVNELRDYYFNELENYLPDFSGDKMLIDKFPLNIIKLFIINRFFPEAKIIHPIRHPYDVCLSNFMQNYILNDEMFNFLDMQSTAEFYDATMSLWNHFTDVLKIDYYIVKYENVVENPAQELKTLFSFLSLPWEDEVLNYYQHVGKRKFIQTPSYQDISKPIFSRAKYRWKKYKQYLEPVIPILKPHAFSFGYNVE